MEKSIRPRSRFRRYFLGEYFDPPSSPFELSSFSYRLSQDPIALLAQKIYSLHLFIRDAPQIAPTSPTCRNPIKICCISDTHSQHLKVRTDSSLSLPPADILVHAGDLTDTGSAADIQAALDYFASLTEYKHKIVIAGNHDSWFDPAARTLLPEPSPQAPSTVTIPEGITYLQNTSTTLQIRSRTINIYGAPQIPVCGPDIFAFQYDAQDGPTRTSIWADTIPTTTDILVTHTPPRGHCDLNGTLGCDALLKECWRLRSTQHSPPPEHDQQGEGYLKVHIFGHVHAGHGAEWAFWDRAQNIYESLLLPSSKTETLSRTRLAMISSQAVRLFNLVVLIIHCVHGIIQTRFLSRIRHCTESKENRATLMVNAAMMVGSTGKLGNRPQLVTI